MDLHTVQKTVENISFHFFPQKNQHFLICQSVLKIPCDISKTSLNFHAQNGFQTPWILFSGNKWVFDPVCYTIDDLCSIFVKKGREDIKVIEVINLTCVGDKKGLKLLFFLSYWIARGLNHQWLVQQFV